MKNILEEFLDVLMINHTKQFTKTLFAEHPHKYNMYGLKRMLDVYGVRSLGVSVDDKDLMRLNYPCILHIHDDFVVGLDCHDDSISYLKHGKKYQVRHDEFKRTWTGNALVIGETTEATEPNYNEHKWNELVQIGKTCSIPVLLILATIVGIICNSQNANIFNLVRIGFSVVGIFVSCVLLEKQLLGSSNYGDKVCSLFHHANCNNVLDGPMAKVLGISWSEVGVGYFIANVLLLSLYPSSFVFVAIVNWVAMLYGIWSIYYQWRIARSWCVLCVIVQGIIWAMGLVAIVQLITTMIEFEIIIVMLSSIVFAICIMEVHQFAWGYMADNERKNAVQRYMSIKANADVSKVLIEKGEPYETRLEDSSIIFGNPKAEMRVTILSNPHCNPCARMHEQVVKLLEVGGDEICVQYIFMAFNQDLEDSSRYLISCYFNNSVEEALCRFTLWFSKEKFDYKNIIKKNSIHLYTDRIEQEMEKHRMWREKTSLVATPTVLVNGYILPNEYRVAELAMIISK